MTEIEKQAIVTEVLAALNTNAKTIDMLTPVTSLSESDNFEVSGGKRISYTALATLISSLSADTQSDLATAIAQKQLQSVTITATSTAATLTITNVGGKTISCSLPIASTSESGIITAVDKTKLDSAYSVANAASAAAAAAQTAANTANSTANAALSKASSNETAIGALLTTSNSHSNDIGSLQQAVKVNASSISLLQTAVQANANNIGELQTAVEANGTAIQGISDSVGAFGGIAPLDELGKVPSQNISSDYLNVVEFDECVSGTEPIEAGVGHTAADDGYSVVYDTALKRYYLREDATGNCYSAWPDSEMYGEASASGIKPTALKVHICKSEDAIYRWNGTALQAIGRRLELGQTEGTAYPGDLGAKNASAIASLQEAVDNAPSVGNVYNATAEDPLTPGLYYTLAAAIAKAREKGYAKLGLGITFEASAKKWRSYQYVGTDTDAENWSAEANWLDNAALGEGSEPFINILQTFGAGPSEGYYPNLSYAIAKVIEKDTEQKYRKSGLVITYPKGENLWETKIFMGAVSNFGVEALWNDFGGSGAALTASDDPQENGTDAFSTGGAAEYIPVGHEVTQADGEVVIQFKNTLGQDVMDPIQFVAVTSGGGEAGGTSMAIKAKHATLYAAYGSQMLAQFSIRSVTTAGSTEQENNIERIEFVDRTSNQVVYSWSGSQASSLSADDYSFSFDISSIFTSAGEKSLKLVAYDELGKSNSKSFKAVAEDVTITCRMPLDYNSGNHVDVASTSATFDCYQFERTSSAVRAYVDILIGGEWVNVHTKLLNDSNKNYTKSITINPSELGLQHGAYKMRMYGVSESCGVTGNVIYTTLFAVEEGNDASMVGIRYDDASEGKIMNFATAQIEVSAYKPGNATGLNVQVCLNSSAFTTLTLLSNAAVAVPKQISGYSDGAVLKFQAHVGAVFSPEIVLEVQGSAVDVALKDNAAIAYDFATRSNDEPDHSISDSGYEATVAGCNWRTNGFVDYLGKRCLRIAENMSVAIPYAPFGRSAVESTGTAVQFEFCTDNVVDADAILLDCYNPTAGAGFYVKGNEIGLHCLNGVKKLETRRFESKKWHTVLIVSEPSEAYEERSGTKYCRLYLYLDGEKIGRIGWTPGRTPSDIFSNKSIAISSASGDFYLSYLIGWNSHVEWSAAMSNYLAKQTDLEAMTAEYDFENVLRAQNAEGVQMFRPQIDELLSRGIACHVYVGTADDFDRFDNGTDTSENFTFDIYHFDPTPWRSFIAYGVRIRRQGTTSAKRPKKNERDYIGKATSVAPMYPDYADEHVLTTEQRLDLEYTYALFAMKYVRVGAKGIPVQVTTIKIDFSDSTGANDSGTCNMINATIRSLAQSDAKFLTPAQRAFDGTFDKGSVHLTGLEMNHSTANQICAVFRSTDNMASSYFEAKGNWKEDKGEQVALGFVDTPGYNKGCKNWQTSDFAPVYGNPGETLDQLEARFKLMSGLDTDQLYLLQPYCSRNYRFMRYTNGAWAMSPGSMKQVGGKWVVTGDVLNPVNGWEMLNYTGMDWCQGVGSVDDLMAGSTEYSSWVQKLVNKGKIADGAQVPAWTYYFECMVDNDDLALAYAQGKVVPFELYQFLRFCDAADYASKADYKQVWHDSAWKYLSLRSNYVTRGAEDYNSQRDSVSKNKQPMAFLEDGHSVANGVYDPEIAGANSESGFNFEFGITEEQSPVIVYFNKVYDIDGANDKDNDGGGTGDPEEDPDKPSDAETGYINTYAGWGSVLFKTCVLQDTAIVDASGTELSYRSTVAAMRSCQTVLDDGTILNPFSPAGALYYYVTDRTLRWPKNVSSFDGHRKYEQYMATSDAIYYYALQGLGLSSIPQYIKTRWRFRDGFYQTGDFFAQDGTISGRVEAADDAQIRIKAAKSGYFAVGNDSSGSVSERVYLQAGESHAFTNFRKNNGALIYLYQADRMSEIDLSDLTLSEGFNFSNMKMAQKIVIGSASHVNLPIAFTPLTQPTFGSLPFLDTIDVRNTNITSVNAESCPRLAHFYAEGSQLATLTLAATSQINDVTLPSTMVQMRFVDMPSLQYKGLGASVGIQVPSLPSVTAIMLEHSPSLDGCRMIKDALTSQEELALRSVRLKGITLHGTGEELLSLVTRTYSEDGQPKHVGGVSDLGAIDKPYIEGTYALERIIEAADIAAIEGGIQGITVELVLEAYIDRIDEVNAEYYGGDAEVEEVTSANIGDHLLYYNGETYEQYVARIAEENVSIHDLILD